MAQTGSKRSEAALGEADDVLPKVWLITQPEFGHELRQAQHMIAELRGQVACLEWKGRIADKHATNLEKELVELRKERDKLEGEVKQLQESENDEVQRLGTENVTLSRQVSHSNVELQTLRNLVQAFSLSETANGVSSNPGCSEDVRKNGGDAALSGQNNEEDTRTPGCSEDVRKNGEDAALSGQNNEEDTRGDSEEMDPCDRESSILRNVEAEPTRIYCVLYPVDALPSTEAQKWLPRAFAYVDVNLGPEYQDLLVMWIGFERIHQWEKSGGRLDKAERPKEITAWITEGCYLPRCKGPKLGADFIKTFPDDMRKWWNFLRLSTTLHQKVVHQKDDWGSLEKHGINGWFSIVAGVKWWGESLKALTGDSLRSGTEQWLTLVEELTESLNILTRGQANS